MIKAINKRPHNIVVTDSTWSDIQAKSTVLKISASEYIERVINSYDESYLSISDRLKSNDSLVIIATLLAFTKNKSKQFGILPNTKKEEEEFLNKIIVNSMVSVSLINYAMPEFYIQDIMPPLRWLTFQSLIKQSSKRDKILEQDIFSNVRKNILSNIKLIISAIAELKKYSPPQYHILKLRHIEGLTWSQISKLLILQGQQGKESDIRSDAKNATFSLRSKYQRDPIEVKLDEETNQLKDDILDDNSIAKEYYNLSCKFPLSNPEEIRRINSIIERTKKESIIEFWLNEIDNQISFSLKFFDDNSYLRIRESIINKFSVSYENQKQNLDFLFEKCLEKKDIYESLEAAISDQMGFKVKIRNIPFSVSL